MRRFPLFLLGCALVTSCQSNNSLEDVISQTFVHKYGFETSEKDWEEREQDGQVVSMLKSGVKIVRTYENGSLHGLTTQTFPHSPVVEKEQLFDEGTLLKEKLNDVAGMPIREEIYEFDNRMILTLWDEKGVPLSIEEYVDQDLIEGKYYTPDHELESTVTRGMGERIKRDRSGLLVSREKIDGGQMVCRTNYHPNGNPHTVSHYEDYELHGLQQKFTASGKPLLELNWNRGVIDGEKIVYRNGKKIAIIPYINGKKQGTELHYDDLGMLTAEIEWKQDKKHGPTQLHSDEMTDTEWFFKGQSVNADKFKVLQSREKTVENFRETAIR